MSDYRPSLSIPASYSNGSHPSPARPEVREEDCTQLRPLKAPVRTTGPHTGSAYNRHRGRAQERLLITPPGSSPTLSGTHVTNGVTTLTESPFNKSNNYNTMHAKIHLRRDRDCSRPEQSSEKSELPSKGFHLKWALKPRQQAAKGENFRERKKRTGRTNWTPHIPRPVRKLVRPQNQTTTEKKWSQPGRPLPASWELRVPFTGNREPLTVFEQRHDRPHPGPEAVCWRRGGEEPASSANTASSRRPDAHLPWAHTGEAPFSLQEDTGFSKEQPECPAMQLNARAPGNGLK